MAIDPNVLDETKKQKATEPDSLASYIDSYRQRGGLALGNPFQQQETTRQEEPGFFQNVAGDVAGGIIDYGEMMGRAGRAIPGGDSAGVDEGGISSKVIGWAEQFKKDNPWADRKDREGLSRWFHEGLRSAVTSLAAGVPGAAVGAAAGTTFGPVGTFLGGLAGYALSGATTFGMAEYDSFLQEADAKGISREESEPMAILSAGAEGGFEFLGDLLQGATLGGTSVVTAPGKAALKTTVKEMLKLNAKQALKRAPIGMGFETGSELLTAGVQTEAQRKIGLTDQKFFDGATQAFGPSLVASAIFQAVGFGGVALNQRAARNTLANADADPEQRLGMVQAVDKAIREQNPELADRWNRTATEAVLKKEALDLDTEIGELPSGQPSETPPPGPRPTRLSALNQIEEEIFQLQSSERDPATGRPAPKNADHYAQLNDLERRKQTLLESLTPEESADHTMSVVNKEVNQLRSELGLPVHSAMAEDESVSSAPGATRSKTLLPDEMQTTQSRPQASYGTISEYEGVGTQTVEKVAGQAPQTAQSRLTEVEQKIANLNSVPETARSPKMQENLQRLEEEKTNLERVLFEQPGNVSPAGQQTPNILYAEEEGIGGVGQTPASTNPQEISNKLADKEASADLPSAGTVTAPLGVASQKQPWEMTREEYDNEEFVLYNFPTQKNSIEEARPFIDRKTGDGTYPADAKWTIEEINGERRLVARGRKTKSSHESVLRKALSEGKPVPPAVLQEHAGEDWADKALVQKGQVVAPKSANKTEFNPDDLDREKVIRGYSHTSRDPSGVAKMEQQSYVEFMEELRDDMLKDLPEGKEDILNAELQRVKDAYLKRRYSVLNVRGNTVSSMIAGKSKFNFKQAESRNNALDKAEKNFDDWLKQVKQDVAKKTGVADVRAKRKTDETISKQQAVEATRKKEKEVKAEQNKLPIINYPGERTKTITSEEWNKTSKDYKSILVSDDGTYRYRSMMREGGLFPVFLSDKKEIRPKILTSSSVADQELAKTSPDYSDPRLKRKEFRDIIGGYTDSITAAGKNPTSFIDLGAEGTQVIRHGSVHPPLIQKAIATAGSVKDLRNAVRKAANGGKLGTRQAEAVKLVLDQMQEEVNLVREGEVRNVRGKQTELRSRRDAYRETAQPAIGEELEATRKSGENARAEQIADDFYVPPAEESNEYPAEWDAETKTLADLYAEAKKYDNEAADSLLESQAEDSEIASQLWEIIQNGRKSEGSSQVVQGQGFSLKGEAQKRQAREEEQLGLSGIKAAKPEFGKRPDLDKGRENVERLPLADEIAEKEADAAQQGLFGVADQNPASVTDKEGRVAPVSDKIKPDAPISRTAHDVSVDDTIYLQDDYENKRHPVNFRGWVDNDTAMVIYNGWQMSFDRERLFKNDLASNDVASASDKEVATKTTKAKDGEQAKGTEQKIEDFGEEIGGARKMLYAEAYGDKLKEAKDVDVSAVPLSKSWPEPDYAKLLEGGMDSWSVSFIRSLRDQIPTKPQKRWKLSGWAKTVNNLRDLSEKVLSGEFTRSAIEENLKKSEYLFNDLTGKAELYEAVGHEQSLKDFRVKAGQYTLYEGVKYDTPKTIWTVEKPAKATAFSNWPQTLAKGETREEVIAAFKKNFANIKNDKTDKQVSFAIYQKRGEDGAFIGKKIGKDYVDLEKFDTITEARKYLKENNDKLTEKLGKFKEVPNERKESNSPRVGEDHRNDADITPEIFSETFGFRGVQFGNYVEGKKRQEDLNQAYDALIDLAGVLGVEPKALSLNGELGLAFGARGTGGRLAGGAAAAAHYESGRVVINLTKNRGAGSLAHEWWHGLDNYFSKMRGDKGNYLTRQATPSEGVRPEMVRAFMRVMNAIAETGMQKRAALLDKTLTRPYWGTKIEMSARSFESYVIAKLQDQGASNDYLANIVSPEYWDAAAALGMEKKGSYPYPSPAEVPAIRAAFDEFFREIETKKTDKGVALFSQAETTNDKLKEDVDRLKNRVETLKAKFTKQEVESEVKRLTSKWKNAPKITVIESVDELPGDIKDQALSMPDGDKIEGVYIPGPNEIFIISSNMPNTKRIEEIIVHEAIGHHGIESIVDQKEFFNILLQLSLVRPEELNKVAEGYGFSLTNKEERLSAAKEVLARMAERGESNGFIRRTIALIKDALRRLGFELEYTDTDFKALIAKGRKFVEKGKGRKGDAEDVGTSYFKLSEKANIDTHEFRKWFGNSKIVDSQGRPRIVFHWTDYEFDAFNMSNSEGSHFGTAQAASDRAKGRDGIDYEIDQDDDGFWVFADSGPMSGDGQGPFKTEKEAKAFIKTQPKRIEPIKAYLKIENPIKMPDLGTWGVWDIIKNLPSKTLTSKEQDSVMEAENKYDALREKLLSKGFDGIEYINEVEDTGSVSYIAFSPTQIKSVFNRGTFSPDTDFKALIAKGRKFVEKGVTVSGKKAGLAQFAQSDSDGKFVYRNKTGKLGEGLSQWADNKDSVSHFGKDRWRIPVSELMPMATFRDIVSAAYDKAEEAGALPGRIDGMTKNEVLAEIDPENIVNSAALWDGTEASFENWVYEEIVIPNEIKGVKTQDGAVVFDNTIALKDDSGAEIKAQFSLHTGDTTMDAELDKTVPGWRDHVAQMTHKASGTIPERAKAMIGKFLSNPWFGSEGKPARRQVVNQNLQRTEDRTAMVYDLSHQTDNYQGMEGLRTTLGKMNTKQRRGFDRLVKKGDIENMAYSDDELKQMGVSASTIKAYHAFRQVIDKSRDMMFERLNDLALIPYEGTPIYNDLKELMNSKRSVKEIKEDKSLDEDLRKAFVGLRTYRTRLTELKQQWGFWKGYAPRVRPDGEWFVRAYQIGADGNRKQVYMRPAISCTGAESLMAKVQKNPSEYLKGNYDKNTKYEFKVDRNTAVPEEMMQMKGSDMAIEALINRAVESATKAGDMTESQASAMTDAILQELNDQIAARGFGRTRIERQKDLIEGYDDENYADILQSHISGMAGWITKSEFSIRSTRAASKIKDPSDKTWVLNYSHDAMANSTYLDRAMAQARSYATLMYLGGKISTSVLNATQNYIVGQAELSRHTKGALQKILAAQKNVLTGKLTEEEARILEKGLRAGRTQAQYVREISGLSEAAPTGKLGKGISWLTQKSMVPFQWVESRWNREPALLAAYRVFRNEHKLSEEDAFKKAEDFVNTVHFVIGKENIPEVLRKLGPLGRTLYTFQSYTHNYLHWLANRVKQGETAVIGRSMLALALLGGLVALPGADDIDKWLQSLIGKAPMMELRKWLKGATGEEVADFVMHGLPSLGGVNFSRSLGVSIPFLQADQETMAERFTGVWSGVAKKVSLTGAALRKGDLYRAAENSPLTPEAFANVMRASRQYTRGATTLSGKPIFDEKGKQVRYTFDDALKKSLGFQPLGQAKRSETFFTGKRLEEYWKGRRQDMIDSYRIAKDKKAVWKDIREFNRELKDSAAAKLVKPVNHEVLIRAMKPAINKRRQAFAEENT